MDVEKYYRKLVKLRLKDGREIIGYVLPRTVFSSPDIIVVKLKNGYNIGIAEEKVENIEVLGEEVELRGFEAPNFRGRGKKVFMLATGGTIASRVDYLTGGVKASMKPEEIVAFIPELAEFAELDFYLLFNKLSEDLTPLDWVKIAEKAAELANKSYGVVITHGTDTMHFTSAALSFMLSQGKPVVLTGAQRSSDRPSSDAFMNIICSVIAATSDIGEVGIVFHAGTSDDFCWFLRGTRARKLHTSARGAFQPVNTPPLAEIKPGGEIKRLWDYVKRSDAEIKADSKIEPKVAMVLAYPGSDPEVLYWYLERGYRGIVIQGTGLGHVPVNPEFAKSWIPVLEEVAREIPVVMTSQCIFGRTHRYVYTNLRKAVRAGAIYVGDMLPEVAYVKLIWVLGHVKEKQEVAKLMQKNLRGEISERTLQIPGLTAAEQKSS